MRKLNLVVVLFISGCGSVGQHELPANFWRHVDSNIEYVDKITTYNLLTGETTDTKLYGLCSQDGQVKVKYNTWPYNREYVELHELAHSYWIWCKKYDSKRFKKMEAEFEVEEFSKYVIKLTHNCRTKRCLLVEAFLMKGGVLWMIN